MSQHSFDPPWFVRKDLDGFFGLMIDNLIQLILIVSLCRELIHLPDSYIFGRILPGAAISILVGNVFYAWQARQLARETGREDVTALPYGINTVSLFAFVFFIMLPIYQETKDPVWAWKIGLVACFLNGIIEIICAFIAESVRFPGGNGEIIAGYSASRREPLCCRRWRHRYYIYFDGFYFQNLCTAFGCYGADGNYLCGLFLAPEISAWLAWRYGGDRGGHSTWMVAGDNDRENIEFDLCFGHAGLCRCSALGGALTSGLA